MTRSQVEHRPAQPVDEAAHAFAAHSTANRVSTDAVLTDALRKQWPELSLAISPTARCQLLPFAQAGHADATPFHDPSDPLTSPRTLRMWMPPARRMDGSGGVLADMVLFARFSYKWNGHDFIVYVANGRDGTGAYPQVENNYILSTEPRLANELITECSRWSYELHNEIWVYDQGYWQKSAELWRSIQKSEWADIILDEDMKQAIISDVDDFFASRETYQRLRVPWKRGLIFWGPPGNGKTISVKATMHTLYRKDDPIPTLYVRSIQTPFGPEQGISMIFTKARQEAPCFLVFEDLDSVVTDDVRSYFLNEVDGLSANDGILMVGSTNHLDRLDPGLSKRPSRFDRKYLFPDPSLDQRTAYAKFWQKKLSSTSDLEFPDQLCPAVAGITDGFSFAYMQEAFVASLLAIARRSGKSADTAAVRHSPEEYDLLRRPVAELWPTDLLRRYKLVVQRLNDGLPEVPEGKDGAGGTGEKGGLEDLPLWIEMQKQVAILREGMSDEAKMPAAQPAPRPRTATRVPAPAQTSNFIPTEPGHGALPHQEQVAWYLENLEIRGGAASDPMAPASVIPSQGL